MKKATTTTHDSSEPRSFVVRIYRQFARGIAGRIEDVESGVARPFGSAEELWAAIHKLLKRNEHA